MLQELFFPPEEFACLVLNLTIPFKLYVADAIEAIEVLKNYLGKNKKGMSYIYIYIYVYIFFICCCCLLFFTVSYKYNTYITYTNNNNCKINNSNNKYSNNVNIIMIYFFV